jgi:hypothetical protein
MAANDTPDRTADRQSDPLDRQPKEDAAQHVARLGRMARLGDPRVQARFEDESEALAEKTNVPDPFTPSESDRRATAIVDLVGDQMPDDPLDPKWRDLVRLIGVPLAEISDLVATASGVTWRTATDRVWHIAVGEQNDADANGRRGIMFLVRPERYAGPFPVYSEPEMAPQTGLTTGSLPGASQPPLVGAPAPRV